MGSTTGAVRKRVEEPVVEPKANVERLNFNVSPAVAAETRQLAVSLNLSMTQLFKFAVSIFKIAVDEGRNGRRLVIADKNGKSVREFIIPGLD
jgi:hypothetical protein